jgi:hypothetical protein
LRITVKKDAVCLGNIRKTQEIETGKEINQRDFDWEKEYYQIGCETTRKEAQK